MLKSEIEQYLSELNGELAALEVRGEVALFGGAVMCLVYDARPSTKDVDAIFRPTRELRQAIKRVAERHQLPDDWLNDAVAGFVVEHPQRLLYAFPHLTVFVPEPDYLLAMKTLAARVDTQDKDDIIFLVRLLGLHSPAEVFAILEQYYPHQRIKPATQFFVEELFDDLTGDQTADRS